MSTICASVNLVYFTAVSSLRGDTNTGAGTRIGGHPRPTLGIGQLVIRRVQDHGVSDIRLMLELLDDRALEDRSKQQMHTQRCRTVGSEGRPSKAYVDAQLSELGLAGDAVLIPAAEGVVLLDGLREAVLANGPPR